MEYSKWSEYFSLVFITCFALLHCSHSPGLCFCVLALLVVISQRNMLQTISIIVIAVIVGMVVIAASLSHSFIGWRTLSQIHTNNEYARNIYPPVHMPHKIHRTLSHSTTAFNLPTAYNLPGQENISDEDDKEKVLVDPKTVDVKDCTKTQVEDIVKGWIRYIKKVLKSYENKVNNFECVPMACRSKRQRKKMRRRKMCRRKHFYIFASSAQCVHMNLIFLSV